MKKIGPTSEEGLVQSNASGFGLTGAYDTKDKESPGSTVGSALSAPMAGTHGPNLDHPSTQWSS